MSWLSKELKMNPVGSTETQTLSRLLQGFHPSETVARCAGLLTAPQLHANTVRIELLVHLAVVNCNGTRKPGFTDLGRWLNKNLGNSSAATAEDPPEDVFISNVMTPHGNFRLFEGTWTSNDFYLQEVLDVSCGFRGRSANLDNALNSALALLKLGDQIARRLSLERWHSEPSNPSGHITVAPITQVEARASAVTFVPTDLDALGIPREWLTPFILGKEQQKNISSQTITRGTDLELHPLVPFGNLLVMTLPAAVGSAIRSFLLRTVAELGLLASFTERLVHKQALLTERCLAELGESVTSTELPSSHAMLPSLQSWLLRRDSNHFIHVVLLNDDLQACVKDGWGVDIQFSEQSSDTLDSFLEFHAAKYRRAPQFQRGITLIVLGGVGRGVVASFAKLGPNWDICSIGLSDLRTLSSEKNNPIERFFKFLHQARWAENRGVHYINMNGDFALYCYWRISGYKILPRDLPLRQGAVLMISGDVLLSIKKKCRQSEDLHVLENRVGQWMTVERYGRDSYFKAHLNRPIFVCTEAVRQSTLAAAVQTQLGTRWLICHGGRVSTNQKKLAYHVWSDFLNSFTDMVLLVDQKYSEMPETPLEIYLDVGSVREVDSIGEPSLCKSITPPSVSLISKGTAIVVLPADFLEGFIQVDNAAERVLMHAFGVALGVAAHSSGAPILTTEIGRVAEAAIAPGGARLIHMFSAATNAEHLLSNIELQPKWLEEPDMSFAHIGLVNDTSVHLGQTIKGKLECKEVLNGLVDKVWGEIKHILNLTNRQSVLVEALSSGEAILADRRHWRRTAQAVLSLHEIDDAHDASFRREQQRNRTSLPTRILMEMAVCECPKDGGGSITRTQYDRLLALIAMQYEIASDSDAIYGDLTKPSITIFLNGEYEVDRTYQKTIMKPFMSIQYQDEYSNAAKEYPEYYKKDKRLAKKMATELYHESFILAFKEEYGLELDESLDCFAELSDLAVDIEEVVIKTTIGEMRKRIIANRGLSSGICDAFFRSFCLSSRQRWDKPPPGFAVRDIWPWLFRRRLSTLVRPILVTGLGDLDKAYFGLGQLIQGMGYLIERSESGRMPQEFFASKAMRSYAGQVANERGALFEDEVAAELCKHGWKARTRIQMTELEASTELGDVDVLAWHLDGRVLAIECKRLQAARTVGEVADVLRKFAGEERDKLARHLNRLEWIRSHHSVLRRAIGFPAHENTIHVRGLLVTNTDVPMMYATGLPIPASDIVPLRSIGNFISVDF